MVTRIINTLEIDIDEKEGNEIYLPEKFVSSIDKFDGDIETIKKNIYKWNDNSEYFPLSIFWEMTNRCCFNCPFCYINTKTAKRYKYITFDYAKKMIDCLLKKGLLFCTLSGGECLLHPEFKKIYRYLKQSGVIVSIFSNGMLIDEEVIELFKEYKPYKVEVSIYGMTDLSFKQATLTNYNYEDVLHNILELKEIGVWIRCKTPITSLTSKDIPQIRKWCNDNGIDFYTSDELLPTYEGESVDKFRIEDEIYRQAVISKEKAYRKNCKHVFDSKRAWDCSAGKYAGVVAADGAFYPCMSCIGITEYKFDISTGIEAAIESYKEILKKERGKQLEFCHGCEQCDICEKCVLSQIKDSKEEISRYCAYMKQFQE